MSRMVLRTISAISTYPLVVTSPAMWTWPVVISVSTATRLRGSSLSMASRIASLIWSAILSGWPSVTDSEVNRRRDNSALLMQRLLTANYQFTAKCSRTGDGLAKPTGESGNFRDQAVDHEEG